MKTFSHDGAEGLRGPRAASGSPVSRERRTRRPRWSVNVDRLDQERVFAGLSQRQLARAARVDPATLSTLLCRRRRANLGTLTALCHALRLELRDVIVFD